MKVEISHQPLIGQPRNAVLDFVSDDPYEESDLSVTGDMDIAYVGELISAANESSVLGYATSLDGATPGAILRTLELMGLDIEWPEAWLDPDFDPWLPDEVN